MPRQLNVARVILDNPLPHLDRLFDYEIPADLDQECLPGVKVKVKFSNRNMEAWVVEKVSSSNHQKKLSEISKVISNYPVLTPEVLVLAQIVADKFLGNLTDVLRFAIPPRQAKIEKKFLLNSSKVIFNKSSLNYDFTSLVYPPCVNRNRYLVDKISEVKQSNKQTILLFPNISLVEEFIEFFKNDNLDIKFQVLSAEQEPGIRYESFLTILNNEVDLVLGTRNAVFAPLNNLGLIAMWDDADENYFSQQSPYWNAREVAMIRAELNKCDFYAFGNSESIAINHAVKTNRVKREDFVNYQSSENWPEIFTLDSSTSDPLEKSKRLPKKSWEIIKDGLNKGNVLIQVPRLGYSSNLQCTDCRESARCISCTGPIFIKEKNSAAECKWCGKIASNWKCRFCNNKDFRISVIGQTKTVEELGKSFPGVQIVTSGGKTIIREFAGKNSIVVATPGAEPRTSEGYSAVVLLDAYLLLGVPSLAASEEALRKWIHVMTLVKPEQLGGKVFITSESNNRVVQALVKRQPNWLIDKELELRVETNLQPAVTSVSLKGDLEQINQIREKFVNDDSLTILGPRIYEKQDLAQIVIGSKNPEVLTSKLRAEIIKFSASRTKPVRAYVNAYDFE